MPQPGSAAPASVGGGALVWFMVLTPEARAHVERFFRTYLHDEQWQLPVVHFHVGRTARALTRGLRVGAITLRQHVFIGPALLSCDAAGRPRVPGWLVAHELMHVIQYRRQGTPLFLVTYLRAYGRALRRGQRLSAAGHAAAYRAIAQEVEAYAVEAAYRASPAGVSFLALM